MARQVNYEDLSHMLPTDAFYKGMRLDWERPNYNPDPVILSQIGHPGRELYRWDYIPSLTEVFEKCKELKEADNGQSKTVQR